KNLQLGIDLPLEQENVVAHFVNTGVPHAVVFLDHGTALDDVAVERLGAQIRYHDVFAPAGTNVNFAQKIDAHTIAIRTYERGVEAETLACGTGVVAAGIIFHELTGAKSPVSVRVRGGDTLEAGFEKTENGYKNVTLTGPAT